MKKNCKNKVKKKKNCFCMQISRFCAKSKQFCAVARLHVLESLEHTLYVQYTKNQAVQKWLQFELICAVYMDYIVTIHFVCQYPKGLLTLRDRKVFFLDEKQVAESFLSLFVSKYFKSWMITKNLEKKFLVFALSKNQR